MQIFLAFAPPLLTMVVSTWLTRRYLKKNRQRNFTTEIKITFSHHCQDEDENEDDEQT